MNCVKHTLILVLLCVSFGSLAETLTQSSVTDLVSKVQNSVSIRDAELFSSYFTDDAIITFDMPINMGGTIVLSKAQYREMLKQGWEVADKYTYEVKNIEITISKGSQSATITDLTIETVEMGGQVISSKSHETIKVVISEGTPLINSLYGKIEL